MFPPHRLPLIPKRPLDRTNVGNACNILPNRVPLVPPPAMNNSPPPGIQYLIQDVYLVVGFYGSPHRVSWPAIAVPWASMILLSWHRHGPAIVTEKCHGTAMAMRWEPMTLHGHSSGLTNFHGLSWRCHGCSPALMALLLVLVAPSVMAFHEKFVVLPLKSPMTLPWEVPWHCHGTAIAVPC